MVMKELKEKIKNILLGSIYKRYIKYCLNTSNLSKTLPDGIDITPRSLDHYIEDENWLINRIYDW